MVKNPAAHHAISAKFPEKVDPKGKPLVVQYEVKLQSMFYNPFGAITTQSSSNANIPVLQTASSVVVPT